MNTDITVQCSGMENLLALPLPLLYSCTRIVNSNVFFLLSFPLFLSYSLILPVYPVIFSVSVTVLVPVPLYVNVLISLYVSVLVLPSFCVLVPMPN